MTAKLRDKDLSINIEPASESLDKYLEKWLQSVVRSRVRKATVDDYKYLLDRYVSPTLGAIKLCDIRSIDKAESRWKKGADYQNNDLVFATSEGTPILLRDLVPRHFQPVLIRAKLSPTFRLYDLRHSCATLSVVHWGESKSRFLNA